MELDALKVDVCKVFSRTEICFSEIFASNIFAFHFSYKFYPVTVQKDISHVIKVLHMILPCIGFTKNLPIHNFRVANYILERL